MGMKRSMAAMFPIMMAAAMMGENMAPETAANLSEKEVDELRIKRRKFLDEKTKQNQIKKYGLKEFDYNGVIIMARNQKNADRKAKNKGLIE